MDDWTAQRGVERAVSGQCVGRTAERERPKVSLSQVYRFHRALESGQEASVIGVQGFPLFGGLPLQHSHGLPETGACNLSEVGAFSSVVAVQKMPVGATAERLAMEARRMEEACEVAADLTVGAGVTEVFPAAFRCCVPAERAASGSERAQLPRVIEALAEEMAGQLFVSSRRAGNADAVRIWLKPQVLSGAEIRMTLREGALEVRIASAEQATVAWLIAHQPGLEAQLLSRPAVRQVAVSVEQTRRERKTERRQRR